MIVMSKQSRVTVDSAGRVDIPKAIRAGLGMSPGAILIAEEHNHQKILLRPLRQERQLTDKGGVLIVRSQAIGEIIDTERHDRKVRVSKLVRETGTH